MSLRSRLIPATVISFFLFGLSGNAVQAQPEENTRVGVIYDNPADLFQRAATYESGNFFRHRDPILQSLQLIFGIPTQRTSGLSAFPEKAILNDAYLVHTLYKDYLEQQAGGEPIITRDLENPFGTSLGAPDYPEP